MSGKNKKLQPTLLNKTDKNQEIAVTTRRSFAATLSDFKIQMIIVVALCCALYSNTLYNQFALDDGMVLNNNKFVMNGVKGIPSILNHDSFYGSIGDTKNLTGGRYRPLSLVSYAMEVSLFGKNPFLHHLINILLFALTAAVLLYFLRTFVFTNHPGCAFVTVILFAVHPVHTEVVANIKSRDEIFSLLFLLLTLIHLLRGVKNSSHRHLYFSLLFYALALLSKENGLIFIAILPLTIFFFTEKKLWGIMKYSIPFIAVAAAYILLRVSLIGLQQNHVAEVMDNPYVLATTTQKIATILFVFLKYLQLLVYPNPLTYDYSYNQIPYKSLTDPAVIVAAIGVILIISFILFKLKKKDLIAWCLLFFIASLALVSNLFFNVGAPMAERFLYQASVPFLIAVVEIVRRIIAKLNMPQHIILPSTAMVMLLILIPSAYATVSRNAQWKSDVILFLHDVKISSGSARANTYAGVALIRMSDEAPDSIEKRRNARTALEYLKRSGKIKSDYVPTLLNEGVAYSRLDSPEMAEKEWNIARNLEPDNANLKQYDEYLFQTFYQRGLKNGSEKNFFTAVINLEKAVRYMPDNADAWYNLGGAYYSVKNFVKAKLAWEHTIEIDPKYTQAIQGLNAINVVKEN